MKKFVALFLALALCLSAFGALAEALKPADVEDTITSADGTYAVAFVTDVGQLKDKSFNEGTWNGVKTYAAANGLTYKYYQPANSSSSSTVGPWVWKTKWALLTKKSSAVTSPVMPP